MKKIISLFLCFSFLPSNFVLGQIFEDNLAEQLNKNLKFEKIKYQPIEDNLAKNLDKNLKIKKQDKVTYVDDFALKTLDPNLKIKTSKQSPILDSLAEKIDKSMIVVETKRLSNLDGIKIKVSPAKYYTTRRKLAEGKYIDFVLVEDTKIEKTFYKKGTIIKARVETLSKNGAYGVPADLVIGNFTMPDKLVLNGSIERQGANRSLWVYPTGYLLTPILLIGLPIFAIRGGHAKLSPRKVFQVEI